MEEQETTGIGDIVLFIGGVLLFVGCFLWFIYSFIGNRAQHALTKAIAFLVSALLELHIFLWFYHHVLEEGKDPAQVATHVNFIIGCSIAWAVLLIWAAWEQHKALAEE